MTWRKTVDLGNFNMAVGARESDLDYHCTIAICMHAWRQYGALACEICVFTHQGFVIALNHYRLQCTNFLDWFMVA